VLLIPRGEVDAELGPNEKVVDESRSFDVHGSGDSEALLEEPISASPRLEHH